MKLPKGFLLTGTRCEISKQIKQDLGIIYSAVPAVSAGVFTRNKVKAAPVVVSMENLRNGQIQAIVANSGCANACTGNRGIKDALDIANLTAKMLKIAPDNVVVASTGVIGSFLPMEKIRAGIKKVYQEITTLPVCQVDSFAQSIMTTDTFPKIATRQFCIGRNRITLTGVAKGAGMICPNMATMLCFLITDVQITKPLLKKALKSAVNDSFNMLTVDGDISTNDMVVILANGLAENSIINKEAEEFYKFNNYLREITLELAKMIAGDGEGATKFLEIGVRNAKNFNEAKKIGLAIANSNLVKTAIFGKDPNWGRIMAAIGSTETGINPATIDIYLTKDNIDSKSQRIKLVNNGCGAKFKEEKIKPILNSKRVGIIVDLKNGDEKATVFSCDLSPDYVKINANYRT